MQKRTLKNFECEPWRDSNPLRFLSPDKWSPFTGLLKWSSSLLWKEWLKSRQFTYCYEFLWLLAILFKSSKESSERIISLHACLTCRNWWYLLFQIGSLNSLLPSSTGFLPIWMLPRLPSLAQNESKGTTIAWVWTAVWQCQLLQTCPHSSHDPRWK